MTDASPAHDPSPEVLAEIDRLDDACRAAPAEIDPQVALWTAVCGLDTWFFINRGAAEQPRPYALAAAQGPMLCVYTSADRAKAAARSEGLVPEGSEVALFAIPLPQALDWALSLGGSGVVGAAVDHPRIGAWTPLPNLARLRDQRFGPSS